MRTRAGEPHDSALFGLQELLHSFRVIDWSVFGDEGLDAPTDTQPEPRSEPAADS